MKWTRDSRFPIIKIKVIKRGKSGVWYNDKIGREYEAVSGWHPCNANIPVFFVTDIAFIPKSKVEIISNYISDVESKPLANRYKVINTFTGEEQIVTSKNKIRQILGCGSELVDKGLRHRITIKKHYKISTLH